MSNSVAPSPISSSGVKHTRSVGRGSSGWAAICSGGIGAGVEVGDQADHARARAGAGVLGLPVRRRRAWVSIRT